ncbi:MAG TPA: hypothetical protein VKD67_07595, partial [Acidimicrobiales bacterium]|nr:hypothetical protein [Acidimicrobiales bacterium]
GAFSDRLGRTVKYEPLALDAFEAGVDAAIGPGVGKQVGAIFRFIDQHPDDRAFVNTPLAMPDDYPSFAPTSPADWIAAHRRVFTAP